MVIKQVNYFLIPVDTLKALNNYTFLETFQAYDVMGLYYGLARTFFNPASVSTLRVISSLIIIFCSLLSFSFSFLFC